MKNTGNMKQKNSSIRTFLQNQKYIIIGAVLFIAIVLALVIWYPRPKQLTTVSLSDLARGIAEQKVVKIEDSAFTGDLLIHYADGTVVKGSSDPNSSLLQQLSLLGVKQDQMATIQFEVTKTGTSAGTPPLEGVLAGLGLMAVMGFVALRLSKGERIGKKSYQEVQVPGIRFSDVAGIDENLQELRDIVTFLREGDKFAEIGAKMPRGVLMVGDPGTGKTLIAKAVAGEAGVPFFATSGSEFTEIFVGVGASRIRSLFQKARKSAPCIVFIDEIDAVGRSRHRSESGAEMEQDQTLNQLLVEMDGFDSSEGVIVLAATNRLDVLDPALTRPGRFDRRVWVNRPDINGREAILNIHVQGKKLSADVSLSNVARSTPGLVGADLANIVNEAAISAVRNGHLEIHMRDFEEAVEKTLAGGVQRKNYVMSEDERRIIAYHETGHAIVMHETELSDPVYKITIIPRGQAGGYTMALPEQERMLMSRCKLLSRITGLLGGRAAEEIFFQDITSGASNDLDIATQLAEEMVMRLGMDRKTGLRVYSQPQGVIFAAPRGSQKTHETIDQSVNQILEDCYADAKRILLEKRAKVELIAGQLLEIETLDREHFVKLMEA